ncbi:MAG: hypothetical protein Faunusvirus6_18 [Faunusvirus sp.]|jgi:hypothetical protein|uniref:Uncharacterized protein n=1 Tax=Faunusvirus sp. TaxID=2487766 RepID=A0A3G4ZWL7_9VIRU|nr:MAG: hypothetical protein Faunusvirus6_18 [Faunusvirus sp.]
MSLQLGTKILLGGAFGLLLYGSIMQMLGHVSNDEYLLYLTTSILYILCALFYQLCM